MNILEIRKQFARAADEGWLDFFEEAASKYGFDPSELMAVASRESNMGGRKNRDGTFQYLSEPGDRGNAFGLMQVDKRYFPDWVRTGRWRDARESIMMGALILQQKRESFLDRKGHTCSVSNRAHTVHKQFFMPRFDDATLLRVTIAAYNCGDWAAYHASAGHSVDQGTTGADYSEDVLDRAKKFRRLLEVESARGRNGDPAAVVDRLSAASPSSNTPESPKPTATGAAPVEIAVAATAVEPSKPTTDEPVDTKAMIAEAAQVPGLKESGKSFLKLAFGGWKRISGWIGALGLGNSAGLVTPTILGVVVICLLVWFIIHTINSRKKGKKANDKL